MLELTVVPALVSTSRSRCLLDWGHHKVYRHHGHHKVRCSCSILLQNLGGILLMSGRKKFAQFLAFQGAHKQTRPQASSSGRTVLQRTIVCFRCCPSFPCLSPHPFNVESLFDQSLLELSPHLFSLFIRLRQVMPLFDWSLLQLSSLSSWSSPLHRVCTLNWLSCMSISMPA